jgi:uncharacterized protein YgbK (DUF1537 family)
VSLTCLLIADDLTGACDAAVAFAARGHVTLARLDLEGDASGLDVLAVTTESRALPAEALRGVFERTARALAGAESRILFKKIDSTLRGNVGMEVALAAEAFACDAAIVTPAFPAMSRIVEAGRLRVAGANFEPIDMAAFWRAQGIECAHVSPEGLNAALASGARFVSVDAVSDADLDAIVRCGLGSTRRILWAGSAGLASALARISHTLPSEVARALLPVVSRLISAHVRDSDKVSQASVGMGARATSGSEPHTAPAVLFCLGSDHPVTLEQERNLIAARGALALDALTAAPECIPATLASGRHVALRIPYGRVGVERARRLFHGLNGALMLTGGDTASLACRALGATGIQLHHEVAPGIPRGAIVGGPFDGAPVVTKSGGFGAPDALIRIADYFTWPPG